MRTHNENRLRATGRIAVQLRRVLVTVAAAAACLVLSDTAGAQYFGRNKVQHEDFTFTVMKTEHFDIYHYERERQAVQQAARLAERWYARLSVVLDHELGGRQPLILYASHPDFAQTNVVQGLIGAGTGGVTELRKRRMVLPFTGSLAETSHVLGHEMVHAFQFDIAGRHANRLPLWFIEGMAEYLSLGPVDAHTALWLRDAALREALPGFQELRDPEFFPYRYGHAAWAYLAGRFGDAIVPALFREAGQNGDPLGAIQRLTGVKIEALTNDWHRSVQRSSPRLAARAGDPAGRALITAEREGGEVNVAPALSPDGRWLVFLSERELFSIDMFLADAKTGEVVDQLTGTSTDPHFDSLQFIDSAGAWDAASQRFVFAAVSAGRPTLNIVDVAQRDVVREIELEGLGEVFHPTWSPDGNRIAFAAIAGGIPDLYVYDLDAGELHRLTNDLYAEMQPAWSPDGERLAFVTDRFSTDLDELDFGNYRLALIDTTDGSASPLPGFEGAKHINPQWNDAGNALYFLSDPNGIPNVYRLQLPGRRITQVTNVATGVTGITALSPALSYAAAADRLAYSLFDGGKYEIYTIDTPGGAAMAAQDGRPAKPQAVLPPRTQPSGAVAQTLRQAERGLPARERFPVTPYDADLALDYVGAAGGLSGLGRFGTFAEGGVTLRFSDMLSQHLVTGTVQVSGGLRDVAGQLSYLNQESRWGWGGGVQQIPYITGRFGRRAGTIAGEPVLVEEELISRQVDRELMGVTHYPFNRAQRLELRAGYRNISFDRELTARVYSLESGALIQEGTEDVASPSALNLGEAAAALVYDTSSFGPTSPIHGSRYRLEVTPTFGSLQLAELLLDYRRYQVLTEPFTLALRGMHIGRFGQDAEDTRLSPLFLGFPNLVRGYDINSFDFSECQPTGEDGGCPVIDNMLGSRLLVGNAELRFPLAGAFTGEFDYGPVPLEGLVFADTGVAWTSDDEPSFAGGNRDWVSSVGVGLRVNLFGYAVAELDAVRPLDRDEQGWMFVFNLRPGF